MTAVVPTRHRFTVEEWERLGHLGFFSEDDRVELIDGQIVDMTPGGPRHANCVRRLRKLFEGLGEIAEVAVQDPIRLSQVDEPQPDVALLRPPLGRYNDAPPASADVLLVIEVADTSLASDRDAKAPRYGQAGIPECWVVDLNADVVLVFGDPGPEGYQQSRTARPGESLVPALLPDVSVSVSEILGLG